MAFRRRFRKNRPAYRKKAYAPRYRRKTFKKRVQTAHHFKRSKVFTTIQSDSASDTFGGFYFGLTDLPNYSEFTALYDQYRINKIVLKFYPRTNVNQVPQSATATNLIKVPQFYICRDSDDSTAPSSIDQMLQYPGCKITPANRKFSFSFIPAALSTMYNDAISSTYSPKFKQWMDIANPQARHYGIKYCMETHAISGAPPDNCFGFDVHLIMYCSFKNIR